MATITLPSHAICYTVPYLRHSFELHADSLTLNAYVFGHHLVWCFTFYHSHFRYYLTLLRLAEAERAAVHSFEIRKRTVVKRSYVILEVYVNVGWLHFVV